MQSDLASSRNTFNSLVSILFTSIQARMLIKLAVIKVEECQKKSLFESTFISFLVNVEQNYIYICLISKSVH